MFFRVPYVGYAPAGLQATAFDGISNYNSLQITVRKQYSHGLTLQGSYTWSKSLTDLTVDSANSNNASFLTQQYGPSYFNRPQRFIINYSYDLPFGKHNGFTGKVLEGWQFSGVTTIQDGAPMSFVDGNAGTAYGTNGTGTTSGYGRAAAVPGDDLWQRRILGRHRIPVGRIQRRPRLFQRECFLRRAGHHAGRSNSNNASRLSHLRHAVWQFRTGHSSGTGPVQL